MRKIFSIVIMAYAFLASPVSVFSQTSLDTLVCNPYNPEDTIGEVVWNLLNDYERFGHFSRLGEGVAKKEYIDGLKNVFVPLSMVPNDLEGFEQLVQSKDIKDYAALGLNKGYVPYTLVAEKKAFAGVRQEGDSVYTGYVRLFKLFSDTARIGKEYDRGVVYELEIQLNADSLRAWISNVTLVDNRIYSNFLLVGYGYQGNSQILLANNLDKLIGYKEPPKPKVAVLSKSNFYLHAGYLSTNYLGAESFKLNENPNASFVSSQYGYVGGLQFQKAYGTNGFFGILFGVEYEINYYDFSHKNVTLSYTTDCDGNALTDLEGGVYDRKLADISKYDETGEMHYLRPEIGLFINVPFTSWLGIQFFGTLGNAFVFQNSYAANATVSYSGVKGDYQVENEPALGFYTDKEVEFSGSLNNLQNFMFYRFGASLDINLARWLALSLQAEYRSSLTYAIRFRDYSCIFSDPDDMRSFVSQFDALKESRLYNAVALQAGFKIYLKEKRRQQ